MDDPCASHSSPKRGGAQASMEVQRQGRQGVIRCGWLRKQGGFVKTWHSRWFVLRGDQLLYYKDEEETKALVRIRTQWLIPLKSRHTTDASNTSKHVPVPWMTSLTIQVHLDRAKSKEFILFELMWWKWSGWEKTEHVESEREHIIISRLKHTDKFSPLVHWYTEKNAEFNGPTEQIQESGPGPSNILMSCWLLYRGAAFLETSKWFKAFPKVTCLLLSLFAKKVEAHFPIFIPTKQFLSSGNLNTIEIFCSSIHSFLSGWFPDNLGAAKPHQQQKFLRV